MQMISDTRHSLGSLTGIFMQCAKECVEIFFRKKSDRQTEWDVVDQLSGNFDCILTLGCASKQYRSILTVGINRDSIPAFTGAEVSQSEACDIFGEFANNYCALLMDNAGFTGSFGILDFSLPILYSQGQSFLPFISGVHGKIHIADKWMYIGFAIKKIN